jgi:hypothetical protein
LLSLVRRKVSRVDDVALRLHDERAKPELVKLGAGICLPVELMGVAEA